VRMQHTNGSRSPLFKTFVISQRQAHRSYAKPSTLRRSLALTLKP
jgi:hypothetical protein